MKWIVKSLHWLLSHPCRKLPKGHLQVAMHIQNMVTITALSTCYRCFKSSCLSVWCHHIFYMPLFHNSCKILFCAITNKILKQLHANCMYRTQRQKSPRGVYNMLGQVLLVTIYEGRHGTRGEWSTRLPLFPEWRCLHISPGTHLRLSRPRAGPVLVQIIVTGGGCERESNPGHPICSLAH